VDILRSTYHKLNQHQLVRIEANPPHVNDNPGIDSC